MQPPAPLYIRRPHYQIRIRHMHGYTREADEAFVYILYTNRMLRFCPLSLRIMEKVIEIREAVREDCREIRNLIQELADFEEMPDGPKIDYNVLEKDGFDNQNPLFKSFVAVCDGKVVGYALYFYIYSTLGHKSIHLEDLYVSPDYRKKYVGSRLFDTIAKKTFDEKCQFLDFSVLSWNPAQNFYKAKGSVDLTEMEGWHIYRLNESSIQYLASNSINQLYEVREARFNDYDSIKRLAQEAFPCQRIKSDRNCDEISVANKENNDLATKVQPYFVYLVVLLDNKIAGYALYCFSYSTWVGKSMYLLEFYISAKEHKPGMKDDLFFAVAKKAYDERCSRIDFWVLDPKIAGQYYISKGAANLTVNEEWHLYRLFELAKKPL